MISPWQCLLDKVMCNNRRIIDTPLYAGLMYAMMMMKMRSATSSDIHTAMFAQISANRMENII